LVFSIPLVVPKRIWTGEVTTHSFLKSWCILLSLQDQEQSLLDAIAKLDEASDRENGKLPWVVTISWICYLHE
jgi:hypothetical protein